MKSLCIDKFAFCVSNAAAIVVNGKAETISHKRGALFCKSCLELKEMLGTSAITLLVTIFYFVTFLLHI